MEEISKIDQLFKATLIKILEKKYGKAKDPHKIGRPLTCEYGHYIDIIFNATTTGTSFSRIISDDNLNLSKDATDESIFEYKDITIKSKRDYTGDKYRKMYSKWCRAGVFDEALQSFRTICSDHKIISLMDQRHVIVDATMTGNEMGSECVGRNHYDRFRNGNKISYLTTQSGFILSHTVVAANVPDISQLKPLLENVVNRPKCMEVLVDKGYASADIKSELALKSIKLIYEEKSNSTKYIPKIIIDKNYKQTKKDGTMTSKYKKYIEEREITMKAYNDELAQLAKLKKKDSIDLQKLVNRSKIERQNAHLQRYGRVHERRDIKFIYYNGHVQIALGDMCAKSFTDQTIRTKILNLIKML